MNSPMRLLQKKTLITETHSSWVLRTSPPFTQVSPAGRQEPPFQLLCLTPRSLRYLNITPSWGVLSLAGLIPRQPHLHCVGSAHSPTSCADPAPGFLSQAQGGPAPVKAACLQPTRCQKQWDSNPCFSRGSCLGRFSS